MSRLLLVVCAGFLLCLFPLSVVADNAVPDHSWIDLLGCDDYAQRERAIKALEARGLDALPALREACKHPDAEVRRSVAELLDRIESQALSRRYLQPRRLSLNLGNTTVSQALAELARQIGAPVQITGNRAPLERRIVLNLGETTFWEALDRVCKEGGLREVPTVAPSLQPRRASRGKDGGPLLLPSDALVQWAHLDHSILLEAGSQARRPSTQVGALRIRALPAPEGNPRFVGPNDLLRLNLEVEPEPSLDWQSLLVLRIDRAIDEHGQNLISAVNFNSGSFSDYPEAEEVLLLSSRPRLNLPTNAGYRQVPLALRAGQLPSRRLRELHGTVAARVRPAAEQLLVAENILKARGQTFKGSDGSLLKVSSVSADDDVYELKLDVTSPLPVIDVALPPFRIVPLQPETTSSLMTAEERADGFSLLDAKGQRLPGIL